MGNGKSKTTKSVDRTSAPSIVVDWKNDAYINHLIVAGRLAPKVTDNTENREAECPICFLNFEYLNTVVCCKQAICTGMWNFECGLRFQQCVGCVVQLKRATATSSCPFCSEKTLTVAFSRSRRISEPGVPPAVYTTPEQERLRSKSSDEIHVSPVSKQTREELEKQISTQRMMYHDPDEESRVFAQAAVRRPRAVTTSSLRQRGNHYDFNNSARGSSSSSSSLRMNQRHSNYQSSSPTRPDGLSGDASILSSLRTILGPSQLDQISSIEELEELMLLEAIRQSQNEVSSATTASSTLTPVAPSVPSPSHHSPSSRRHRNADRGSQQLQQQQLLGEFRDSVMSNSVSSSGSNRLDSGSEGNKSSSQLSEMDVAAALNAVDIPSQSSGSHSSNSSGGESSSSSSSSTGSGGGSVVSVPQNNQETTAASAMTVGTEGMVVSPSEGAEEDEPYDEELELALQLSLMQAVPKPLSTHDAEETVVVFSGSSSGATQSRGAIVEEEEVEVEENSKLSAETATTTQPERPASVSEGIIDFTTPDKDKQQQQQLQQKQLPQHTAKSVEARQAYNNNWLNAFESELSHGKMVTSAEGQPSDSGSKHRIHRNGHNVTGAVAACSAATTEGGASSSSDTGGNSF